MQIDSGANAAAIGGAFPIWPHSLVAKWEE